MPYSAVPLNKGPVGTFFVLKTFFVSAREQHSGGAREQKQILKTDSRPIQKPLKSQKRAKKGGSKAHLEL